MARDAPYPFGGKIVKDTTPQLLISDWLEVVKRGV